MPITSSSTPVILDRLGFRWPDGTIALDGLSGAFGAGRTGIVGRNGSGKSTLLRLIAGELSPSSGHVHARGEVSVLPQTLTLRTDMRVADLLGVGPALDAYRAIVAGASDPAHFDAIGDDWAVESRAQAALEEAGMPAGFLDRTVGALSGGESVLVALAGIRLRGAPITLLDEPTNNLDRAARARLGDLMRTWRGTLLVVSHDEDLLEFMDDTAELYDGALRVFGGPYSAWLAQLESEQEAARRDERDATQAYRFERRQRIAAETTLAHRSRTARKAEAENRVPRIIAHARRGAAEVSAGKLRTDMSVKEDAARAAMDAAGRRVRRDDSMAVEIPDPAVPRSRRIATIGDDERSWTIQGAERVALIGRNGAGKTTLLRRLVGAEHAGQDAPDRALRYEARSHVTDIGYLPQRGDDLPEDATAFEVVAAAAPTVPERELRNRMARFLLRGAMTDRPIAALSGGERFRLSLARMLLADPPPQLVVLDEPTNNLDLDTVHQLIGILRAYRGAILIVSHDDAFLRRVSPDLTLEITEDGGLRAVSLEEPSAL